MPSSNPLVIDPSMLTTVVRTALQSPTIVILEWTTSVLANRGGTTPDGVLLVSGRAQDSAGIRPWAVALKRSERPAEEPPVDNLFYARRELLLYQSSWLTQLPGPVLPARCYGIFEDTEAIWL